MGKNRILTRTVWVLSLVSLLADVASEMLYPIVPGYLRQIGFSVFLIGLLEGVAEAVAGLGKGYFGHLSDRLGQRVPFVRWGYFLGALSKPMMAAWTAPLWIFSARALDRIGKGLRTAPRDALLSAEATPATKARVFSFHRGMDTLGAVLGPLGALLFLRAYPDGIRALFFLAFLPGLLSVAVTFFLKEKLTPLPVQGGYPGFFAFLRYWHVAPAEYRKLLVGLVAFALFNSSDILLLLRVREATGSEQTALGVYIFYNLIYALAAYPLGVLADRSRLKTIFGFGLLLFAVTYLGMAYAQSTAAFFVLFGIYGVYMAATDGIAKAWITNLVSPREAGTAVGLLVALQSLSALVASTVAGLLWSGFGAAATFLTTAGVSLLVLGYVLLRVREPPIGSTFSPPLFPASPKP